MKSNNNKARILKNADRKTSVTPSIDLLNRKIGPSPVPRMLTPYEIVLLRQCVEETVQVAEEVFASREDT